MAFIPCPDCGELLASFAGHVCKKSGGGVGSRHAERQADDGLHSAGRAKPQRSRDSGKSAIGQVRAEVQTTPQSPKSATAGVASSPPEPKPKFDRATYHREYMRDYMRKRREKAQQS